MNQALLIKTVERLSNQPEFVAYLIRLYLEHNQLSWEALARYLNVSVDQLLQLALCRRPNEAKFRQGIGQIVAFVPIAPIVLANFLREAQGLEVFGTSGGLTQMAARDRDPEDGA